VELGLKVAQDEEALLREVLEKSGETRRLNETVRSGQGTQDTNLALGELLAGLVRARQETLADDIAGTLRKLADDEFLAPPAQDDVLNASFLVEREKVQEFAQAEQERQTRTAKASASGYAGHSPRTASSSATSGKVRPARRPGTASPGHRPWHTRTPHYRANPRTDGTAATAPPGRVHHRRSYVRSDSAIWELPLRLTTGAFTVASGLSKTNVDEATVWQRRMWPGKPRRLVDRTSHEGIREQIVQEWSPVTDPQVPTASTGERSATEEP
jgi:hypothetical protein